MSENRPWFAHYEKSVPQTIDIPDMPLYELLTEATRRFPHNVAVRMVLKYLPLGLVIQSKMTYRELDEASNRFALDQTFVKPVDMPTIPDREKKLRIQHLSRPP